jgi:hypothetical protein
MEQCKFSDMCSTQADNSSGKFRLHCGCQFPWCVLVQEAGRAGPPNCEVVSLCIRYSMLQRMQAITQAVLVDLAHLADLADRG